MPIRIPVMHRRGLADGSPASGDKNSRGFVPPHLLDLHADATTDAVLLSLKDSPSQAVKREKLKARNAILRSTGFIEVQSFAPVGVGSALDATKEGAIGSVSGVRGVSRPLTFERRPTAHSRLTALLSSST